jgi:hypothetical protein
MEGFGSHQRDHLTFKAMVLYRRILMMYGPELFNPGRLGYVKKKLYWVS